MSRDASLIPFGPPPQQLAADPSHPWFDEYWARCARVFVNGAEVKGVVLADGLRGFAIGYDLAVPFDHGRDRYPLIRYDGDVAVML